MKAINFLEIDKKLNSYTEKNICSMCLKTIVNKTMILQEGGDPDCCYSCNVHRGLIQ